MLNFEALRDRFLEESTNEDPLGAYFSETGVYDTPELEKKLRALPHHVDMEKVQRRSLFFIPISRQNLKKIFDTHLSEIKDTCDFILFNLRNKATTLAIEISKQSHSLILQMYQNNDIEKSHFKTFELTNELESFDSLIERANDGSRYELKYYDPFIKFFYFVHAKFLQETVSALEQEVSKLREEKQSRELVKMPVNMFNVMLTNKAATLEKIEGKIVEIENAIKLTTDEKRLARLQKQKKIAKEILEKANINFPEDFYFPVYQHYAIFGGMKLLHANNFKATAFTATAVLEALNFAKINKFEVTEIRKAFAELTVKRFPCYYVRPDKSDPNVYHFSDADSPIFMVYEEGRVDLNVDLTDDAVARKKLYLCLLNPALIDDLQRFFSIIDSNLLANLRDVTKVTEEDLYFIEFLIREKQFRKQTQTTLNKLCKIMKKDSWIEPSGVLSRDHKRRIKDKVSDLLNFSVQQQLVKEYTIAPDGSVAIMYLNKKEPALLECAPDPDREESPIA